MKNKFKKLLFLIAYKLYTILTIFFSLCFLILVLLHFWIYNTNTPTYILYVFCFVSGIYVGFIGAHYSHRYLYNFFKKEKERIISN